MWVNCCSTHINLSYCEACFLRRNQTLVSFQVILLEKDKGVLAVSQTSWEHEPVEAEVVVVMSTTRAVGQTVWRTRLSLLSHEVITKLQINIIFFKCTFTQYNSDFICFYFHYIFNVVLRAECLRISDLTQVDHSYPWDPTSERTRLWPPSPPVGC